jgi:hypothetical protein
LSLKYKSLNLTNKNYFKEKIFRFYFFYSKKLKILLKKYKKKNQINFSIKIKKLKNFSIKKKKKSINFFFFLSSIIFNLKKKKILIILKILIKFYLTTI